LASGFERVPTYRSSAAWREELTADAIPTSSIDFDPFCPSNSVSVIIPVYNGARFIAETLKSVLAQTAPPLEVIIVNDGSTDNTASVVEAFGDSVTLIHIPNGGACAARNFGASIAKGNWLAFCDQDDLWLPTKLEKQLRLANEAPEVHCVLTDYAEITSGVVSDRTHFSWAPENFWLPEQNKAGFIVRQPITGKLTIFQPGITSTPIVKRDFFHSAGGFDVNVEWGAEDTCFHFRCLSVVPFGVIPEVLMHYRRHPDAGSADPLKQLRKTVIVWNHIIAKYPQAQPYRAELLQGLVAMRKEIKENERYRRRQKLKHLLGLVNNR
jgi:glycosyltransferase involved in cell wall biosynthesis